MSRDTPPPPPPPLARLRSSGRGGSLPGHNTRCTLRPPPLLSCPPEGREKVEVEVPACGTSEEVPARGVAPGAGGTEPEGHDLLRSLYVLFLAKSSHCPGDQPTQKSQVMSRVHILPLHLAQVGWGSLSNEDRNAPHFRPPTPRQIRNSLDIT